MALRDIAEAPPARPPRFSLIGAVDTVDDAGLRWAGGSTYSAEVVAGSHGGTLVDLEDCYAWAAETVRASRDVETDPVVLWAGIECSTLSPRWRNEAEARARRVLQAVQSYDLAGLAWARLAEAPVTVTAGAAPAVEALACVEEALAAGLAGPAGVVHVSPGVLALLASAQAVRLDGSRWVTPIGTVVAADAGYAGGAGPAGAAGAWMIGTGDVRVRLGAIETSPAEPGDWASVGNLRTTNTVKVLAFRAAAVELDLEAVHVAAQVDLVCA